ncbi:Ribosomal RNA small subunit methyltransferase E [Carex littledalei]|uniref:16S rRNA (uracil(1498)-N(3))-methyltransferase n=1 Tax=Carex littledalei TaxID=544730 RepID=A0A833QA20_9POAL|nr:Ribosomal RNA small subunit methyltransferase E [Carex littledalei]
MRTASVRFSLPVLLHRRIVPRGVVGARSSSSQPKVNQSRGGLPRFHSPSLPSSEGDVVRIQGDEFWHMTRVLRLSINDRLELFDGSGCLVEGTIQRIDKNGSDIVAVKDPITVAPYGMQWHVFAAFGTLKGGRADWLIEKCTELGASSVTPLLTERCCAISENKVDRLQRVMLAAVKQCQRLHQMAVNSPMDITDLLPIVSQSKPSFIAVAEATPLFNILSNSTVKESGVLIVGPEGDFTEEELKMMKAAGATPVGLGACRLRVETATIALMSTLMLWSDAQNTSLD